MGCKNCNGIYYNNIEYETEIGIYPYSSIYDNEFDIIENKYNFLKYISLNDFIYYLYNSHLKKSYISEQYYNIKYNNYKDSFYKEEMSIEHFQNFLENRILTYPLLYQTTEDEKITEIFIEICLYIYRALKEKMNQYNKNQKIIKGYIIAIGFILCSCKNIQKIKILFNLFRNENILFYNEEFKNFLLCLFLISSYCMIYSRNKICNNYYQEIKGINFYSLKNFFDFNELNECYILVEYTLEKIFDFDLGKHLYYNDFKQLFNSDKESLGWILSSKGIRYQLKKINEDSKD